MIDFFAASFRGLGQLSSISPAPEFFKILVGYSSIFTLWPFPDFTALAPVWPRWEDHEGRASYSGWDWSWDMRKTRFLRGVWVGSMIEENSACFLSPDNLYVSPYFGTLGRRIVYLPENLYNILNSESGNSVQTIFGIFLWPLPVASIFDHIPKRWSPPLTDHRHKR